MTVCADTAICRDLKSQVISGTLSTECSCEQIRDYAAGQTGTDAGIWRVEGGVRKTDRSEGVVIFGMHYVSLCHENKVFTIKPKVC